MHGAKAVSKSIVKRTWVNIRLQKPKLANVAKALKKRVVDNRSLKGAEWNALVNWVAKFKIGHMQDLTF